MATRAPRCLLTLAAAVVALLCLAPASPTRAESHHRAFRSSLHRHVHARVHANGGAALCQPTVEDEDDDGIADDDAAVHGSISTVSFDVDPALDVVPAVRHFPAVSGHQSNRAPRAPPPDLSA